MCLGIPGKIIKIYDSSYADVDFGGVIKKINGSMLVHAGFAIEILSAKDANETISLMLNLKE
ncbi:MAG: HypC/HybG/HupF family hydrogenase formation chaperone [Candidatus Altiarchaeales archaeon HGW-Altiarchaeales-2]|nr:MAG: HypC/HybG/HupF family hydrogenase formation chaperone [Candidatus Altiarchaeales archaeon HGW-Altiarchaeales-2]